MNYFFITGTDTDCGKTYATCQLLIDSVRQNKKAVALKPIASGCIEKEGRLIHEDVEQLNTLNYSTTKKINRWCFNPPMAPHIAAQQSQDPISIEELADFCFDRSLSDADYIFIEGAGGLMAPINDNETWVDFLKITHIQVILVVGMRLGCINHALLTNHLLTCHQIPCVGWIANVLEPEMLALTENIKTLQSRMNFPHLAVLSYGGGLLNMSQYFEHIT